MCAISKECGFLIQEIKKDIPHSQGLIFGSFLVLEFLHSQCLLFDKCSPSNDHF